MLLSPVRMRREYDQCRETRTRTFFKLKLLQELKVVEIFGVVFGRSLSPTCDPVWERPCGRWPGDGVPDELVSWGVRNSWYFQTTYTGTVPGLVNFMMGDGDLAKNATGRPCRNAQRFNFPLRRAVFKVQVAERFETFWPRPEREGGEAWSSHLHGRGCAKTKCGELLAGVQAGWWQGGTGDSANPRRTCATASVFQQPRSHSSRHLSTTPPIPSNPLHVIFYPAPDQEDPNLTVRLPPVSFSRHLDDTRPSAGLPRPVRVPSPFWRRREVENPPC